MGKDLIIYHKKTIQQIFNNAQFKNAKQLEKKTIFIFI